MGNVCNLYYWKTEMQPPKIMPTFWETASRGGIQLGFTQSWYIEVNRLNLVMFINFIGFYS